MKKHLKGNAPTPMIGLKMKLRKYFDVFDIDEYNTSKINCYTGEPNGNLKVDVKVEDKEAINTNINEKSYKMIKRELHTVRTYKMLNGRIGCINRDINATRNMRTIVKNIFETGERPLIFNRKQQNNANHSIQLKTIK